MILLLALFLLFIGLVTMFESAIVSFDKDSLSEKNIKKEERIKKIVELQRDPEKLFSFTEVVRLILLVFSLLQVLAILYFYSAGPDDLQLSSGGPLYSVIFLLFILLYLLFGLLLPKGLGKRYSESVSLAMIPMMGTLVFLFFGIFRWIISLANFLLKPLDVSTTLSHSKISEEEIRVLLTEGVKSGEIETTEHAIIENVFQLNDLRADEVMVPRTEMAAVELSNNQEEVYRQVLRTGHSHVPVYIDSLDNITGVVHTKDLMRVFLEDAKTDLAGIIHQAYFVPETKLISEILREMQARGERIAIVTDEYGGTEGVITLEDILGEIVGKIKTEGQQSSPEMIALPDGKFLILGSMDLESFNAHFSIELPLSDDYNTIAGFIAFISGKILNTSEIVVYEQLQFELIKKVKQKMVQFRICRTDGASLVKA